MRKDNCKKPTLALCREWFALFGDKEDAISSTGRPLFAFLLEELTIRVEIEQAMKPAKRPVTIKEGGK